MNKQKEGFGNALEEAYDGSFLKNFVTDTQPEETFFNQKLKQEYQTKDLESYEQKTNNIKYPEIPCANENYDGGMCRALYKKNTILMRQKKQCRPGFDCTRVGFYCSKEL